MQGSEELALADDPEVLLPGRADRGHGSRGMIIFREGQTASADWRKP